MTLAPFDQIVAEHGATVLRVCRALVGPDDADDVWSETFLSALRAYPTLRADSNVGGWLVTIAHNRAIDSLRARGRRPLPSPDLADRAGPETPVGLPDQALRDALVALPPKQQGAVIYRYLGDLPYAEVARLIDSSEAAARRSAADGIAALRARFAEGLP